MSPFITAPEKTLEISNGLFPAHYGKATEEYARFISGDGFFEDTATEWLEIKGPDAETFLMGMLTLDLKSVAINQQKPAFALDAAGKILAYVHICRKQPNSFLIACPPGTASALAKHLDRYVIMEEVELQLIPDLVNLIFFGDALIGQAVGWCQDQSAAFFQRNRAGKPVIECPLPRANAEKMVDIATAANCRPIGWEAIQQARIESFEPVFPEDIEPDTNPVIYGIEEAISAQKGCYIGQETVAMTRDRGRPPYVLVQLRADSKSTSTVKTDLSYKGKVVGHSHSQVFSTKFHVAMRIGVVKFKIMADKATQLSDHEGHTWHIERFNNSGTS